MVEVASLEDVPLREVWPDEAKHFTPWLAQHPDHPGKALQRDLELEGDEMPVGPFSADVVLRDANTGHRVVVENLLETTDHDHLRKLIEWWAEFLPAFREAHPGWSNAQTPKPANWFSFPSGRSEVRYELSFAYPTGATNYSLRAEVYLPSGAPAYQALEAQRAEIEAACNLELVWEPLENATASRIATYLDPVDPADRESWPQYRAWAIETLGELRRVFTETIKNLP